MADQKTKLANGDEIILKLSSDGTWRAHVKYAAGGISGRAVPFKTFDDAISALKEDHAL